MALQSTPYTRKPLSLRFPKEVVTSSLWTQLADLGWTQYVVGKPSAPSTQTKLGGRTYREIAASLPSSPCLDALEGCVPAFTEEEIKADPRLEAILNTFETQVCSM